MDRIIFTEGFKAASVPGVIYIYDSTANLKEENGFFRVDQPDLELLDELHSEIQRANPKMIVGFGSLAALNAAKVLATRRLKKGGLKQAIFEEAFPSIPIVLVPTRPSLCTDVCPLTLVFDRSVPVYYARFIAPQAIIMPSSIFSSQLENNSLYRLLLKSFGGKITVRDYISGCERYAGKLFSPEFIMSLSIAALNGSDLERTVGCIASLAEKSGASDYCPGDFLASLLRIIEKKIDNLVEHSWSFYRNFLVGWGIRDRGELYKKYLTLLPFV